jgi:RNase P subunit RPR2
MIEIINKTKLGNEFYRFICQHCFSSAVTVAINESKDKLIIACESCDKISRIAIDTE